jgi:hypothetical protein
MVRRHEHPSPHLPAIRHSGFCGGGRFWNMKVKWEVDDGYVGASRPQVTEVDDDELAECETEDEREHLINERIQEDFDERINWYRK